MKTEPTVIKVTYFILIKISNTNTFQTIYYTNGVERTLPNNAFNKVAAKHRNNHPMLGYGVWIHENNIDQVKNILAIPDGLFRCRQKSIKSHFINGKPHGYTREVIPCMCELHVINGMYVHGHKHGRRYVELIRLNTDITVYEYENNTMHGAVVNNDNISFKKLDVDVGYRRTVSTHEYGEYGIVAMIIYKQTMHTGVDSVTLNRINPRLKHYIRTIYTNGVVDVGKIEYTLVGKVVIIYL